MHAAFRVEEVTGVEEIPLTVRVPEGVWVDREAVVLAVEELGPCVPVRPLRTVARRHAQLELFFLLAAHRVVEEERATAEGDFRGPVLVVRVGRGRGERA